MSPPSPKGLPRVRPIFTKHAKEQMALRRYDREAVKQIFEEYCYYGVLQDSVLRPGEPPYRDNRFILMVEQHGFFHRIPFAFICIKDCHGKPLNPVEAKILTVIFEDKTPPLPDCPVVELDGSYELPERDWEKHS